MFWLLLLGCLCIMYEVKGENSTSGPQPYQPYEAEVTNSLFPTNIKWYTELYTTISRLMKRKSD